MPEYGEPLTEREKEILRLVATGVTNREVARQLSISVNTVKVHMRHVLAKLGAESRTEATMIAVREGWVTVGGDVGAGLVPAPVQPVAPEPPLPWPKRVALIAALLLAAAGIAVTWPRNRPEASAGLDLPPGQLREQSAPVPPENTESPWHEQAQMSTRRAYMALAATERRILAIGGLTPSGVTAAVEVYDPENNVWMPGRDKPTPVAYVSAATIGTEVYVPGGCDDRGAPTRSVEVYDVTTNAWHEVSPLPEPRCAYALATLDQRLYLFGGWDGGLYVTTVYAYDPQVDTWTEGRAMHSGHGLAAAASLEGKLYVVGGYDGERELTTCAAYDPAEEAWEECAPLTVGRGGLGLVTLGNQLYAIGGGGWTSYLGFNERYNPADDGWSTFETPLVGEWRGLGAAVSGTKVYAIGGWSGDHLGVNQAYELLPFHIFIPVSHQQ